MSLSDYNMNKETVVALRQVYAGVRREGGAVNIPVTDNMLQYTKMPE
mgnify:CR=1 FL=1